jgi:transcriptional regulator with XRE-family HTH domain
MVFIFHNWWFMTIQSVMSNQITLAELGQRLAHHRLNQNLTQQDLAREAGIGVNTVHRVEQGHSIQLSNLIRLMQVLELADNFNQLVPSLPLSPIQQAKLKKERRQRASAPKKTPQSASAWKWGDES